MTPSQYISIHAPARGATKDEYNNLIKAQISIHAPARGATLDGKQPDQLVPYFNPRSREGSDR